MWHSMYINVQDLQKTQRIAIKKKSQKSSSTSRVHQIKGLYLHQTGTVASIYSFMLTVLVTGKRVIKKDPELVLSRTDFVIMFASCIIAWASRLQTEICLSTVEEEYMSLSTAIRNLIPHQNLLNELSFTDIMKYKHITQNINVTVFEDNNGTVDLVSTPKIRLRKHICIKYHWFKKYIEPTK